MPDIQKVTVLLADGDTLRRDGMAAVLQATAEIEIVGGCPNGHTALEEIRNSRPDVAVVDLNLPDLNGIELVRSVRGEALGTKIIILSGTMDDEIVREVVRAGADAYLLKNSPSRHLIDAINYVRDGGQYFSPQLGRSGRDRHLLEEPPRVPPESADHEPESDRDSAGPRSSSYRSGRERRPRPHTADPARFRERIREEASRDLQDRDYEIMSEMADGIRPILDRLDEIESRVIEMEEGEQPVPADPRGWLNAELAETLHDSRSPDSSRGRGGKGERGAGRTSSRDIEARLPQLIEEAVTRRFQSMAGKLQEEIEEQHVRTLETFVKNIQVKLVQRVSALEQNMSQQAEAMHELREYNQRTEDNLTRLISGVDKLAHELPKRLAAAQEAETAEAPVRSTRDSRTKDPTREKRAASSTGSPRRKNPGPKIFWAVVAVAVVIGGVYEIRSRMTTPDPGQAPAMGKEIQTAVENAAKPAAKSAAPAPGADTKTKLEAAKQYVDRKEYPLAEEIYKQVVQAEPNNEDALKGLASVLYREDKIEESTAILDRLPKN